MKWMPVLFVLSVCLQQGTPKAVSNVAPWSSQDEGADVQEIVGEKQRGEEQELLAVSASQPKSADRRTSEVELDESSDSTGNGDFDAVDELGIPEPASIFSQSFALRRVSPLEFNQVQRTPDGVPVYNQPIPQNRGGTLGFGGVYPIHGGFEEEDGPHGQLPLQGEEPEVGHGGGGGGEGGLGGGVYDGYSYDDFDYGGGAGSHGPAGGQQEREEQADDYGYDYEYPADYEGGRGSDYEGGPDDYPLGGPPTGSHFRGEGPPHHQGGAGPSFDAHPSLGGDFGGGNEDASYEYDDGQGGGSPHYDGGSIYEDY